MKNKIKSERKVISLFEIFVIVVGTLAFGYLLGDEFRLVSADAAQAECGCQPISTASGCPKGWSPKQNPGTPCQGKQIYCCKDCGNGGIDLGEDCDPNAELPERATCGNLKGEGYTGSITCNADCTYNKDNCKLKDDTEVTAEGYEEVPKTEESLSLLGIPTLLNTFTSLFPQDKKDSKEGVATNGTTDTQKENALNFGESFAKGGYYIALNLAAAVGLGYTAYSVASGLGANEQWSQQLGLWIGIGYGAGYAAALISDALKWTSGIAFGPQSFIWGGIGAAVGGLACVFGLCKEAKIDRVTFTCFPWQPEAGGEYCGECNTGEFPCTKYKCESLGLGCELLNAGTGEEVCAWKNRNDISPPVINSWDAPLPEEYTYTPDTAIMPPDKGVIINYEGSEDGCFPPFSRVSYGFSLTDANGEPKPGKCKADVNVRKKNYNEMSVMLSSGLTKTNHTLYAFHGGVNAEGGLNIPNGGEYEIFIRCESVNGYATDGTFIFKYCVSDEPDRTAPKIMLTDPLNGWSIQYEQISEDVSVYIDKPSECRWSHKDEDFDLMAGTMICDENLAQVNANLLYECSTTLTGLLDGIDNKFYFRCKSYPTTHPENERYKNEESYIYTLIGTRPLVIDYVTPDGITISDATDSVKVELEAHTSAGYKNGESICYYKETLEPDDNYVAFGTDYSLQNSLHTQELWLTEGGYDYSVRCCDLGSNCDNEDVSFIVETDRESPIVTRVYNDNKKLKIITNEEAECVYDMTDCTYNFEDGVALTTIDRLEHVTDWNTESNFYIKCKDKFGMEPYPNECSIIARPFSGY